MATSPISVELDAKQLERFRKRAERWRGRPLASRLTRGTNEAARLMVRPIKAEAPRVSGGLRKSVKVIRERAASGFSAIAGLSRQGIVLGTSVGPTAPHRALVIWGTKPHSLKTKRAGKSLFAVIGLRGVTRSGRRLENVGIRPTRVLYHPGSKADPFVDRAADKHARHAYRAITRELEKG